MKELSVEDEAKADIFSILETCPHEVMGLLKKLEAGQIDGGCYLGECKCLLGTLTELNIGLENSAGFVKIDDVKVSKLFYAIKRVIRNPNPISPAEEWFKYIGQYSTPENNVHASLAADWIKEWLKSKEMVK